MRNSVLTEKIHTYYGYFNEHNWEAMAAMYNEAPVFKDPSLGVEPVILSRQQIIDKYSELNQIFPDISDEIVQIYPSGDSIVIVEFISKGTNPDGTLFILPICTIFKFENGLITSDLTYYNMG